MFFFVYLYLVVVATTITMSWWLLILVVMIWSGQKYAQISYLNVYFPLPGSPAITYSYMILATIQKTLITVRPMSDVLFCLFVSKWFLSSRTTPLEDTNDTVNSKCLYQSFTRLFFTAWVTSDYILFKIK